MEGAKKSVEKRIRNAIERLHSDGMVSSTEVVPGSRFGSLTVTEVYQDDNKRRRAKCVCDCGRVIDQYATNLTRRKAPTRSCGCAKSKRMNLDRAKRYGLVDGTMLAALRSTAARSNTGVRGVYQTKSGTFLAIITLRGKQTRLGTFSTLEEAARIRKTAERELFDPVLIENGWKPTHEEVDTNER